MDLEHYLDAKNTSPLASAIKSAWAVFNQTIQMYPLDEICIGFNGGKDCTAVLHPVSYTHLTLPTTPYV